MGPQALRSTWYFWSRGFSAGLSGFCLISQNVRYPAVDRKRLEIRRLGLMSCLGGQLPSLHGISTFLLRLAKIFVLVLRFGKVGALGFITWQDACLG
jgi:hypothetical protein